MIDEQEYTYWIEVIAFSGRRFRRLWDDATTGLADNAVEADGEAAAAGQL